MSKTSMFLPLTVPDIPKHGHLRQAVRTKLITINDGRFLEGGRESRELCFLN